MKIAKLDDFFKSQKPWEVEGVEWREVKLEDLIEKPKGIQRGPWGGQIKKEIFVNSGYPVYEQGNVIRNNFTDFRYFLTQKKFDEFKNYHVKPGDFLITSAGTMGIIREVPDFAPVGVINQALMRIRINKNKIIPSYFLLYFNYLIERVKEEYSKGSAMKNLASVKVLKQLPFIIPFRNGKPDLETQKKIVEHIEANFSKIDKILEKKKKELEQLDELWESVLEHAFKPKEGEEWREVGLGEIANIIRGVNFKKSEIVPANQGEAVITASHIRENHIIKENLIFIPSAKVKTEQKVKNNDIVIVMSTGSRTALGRTYYSQSNEDVYIGAFLGIIRCNCAEQCSKFIYFFTKTQKFKAHLLGYTGSQINNISISKLKNLKILIPFRNNQPDLEKQKEIANYLDSVYEKIKALKEKIQSQITLLEEMKESILDEVFGHENK